MPAHLTTDPAPAPAAEVTGPWLALSAALTDEIPALADRDDLIVACTPGAGRGAPACFVFALATVEVDGTHLPVDPGTCQPAKPSDRDRYPAFWGALVHEAAHAAHSRWEPPYDAPAAHVEAAMSLEESRVECAQISRRPGDRHWIRACVSQLVQATFDPAKVATDWAAAEAAALILARADAGILDADETAALARAARAILGDDRLEKLREVWRTAQRTTDDDQAAMLDLGRRWCEILNVDPDQPPPNPSDSSTGDDEEAGTGQGQNGTPSVLASAVTATLTAVDAAVQTDSAPPPSAGSTKADAKAAEAAAQKRAAHAAQRVFGPGPQAPRSWSAITGDRPPRPDEAAAARRLARALRHAAHRERTTTTSTSATPPGRLRMRAALARDAQRAAGAVPAAEPFTRTTRRQVPSPPLRLGVACDVSGSMDAFTRPVASAAWILARAASHVPDAESATVTFGSKVEPVTYPGHSPARVPMFGAWDRAHQISEAIDALDSALSLSGPGAARLLVIVSDGYFEQDQITGGQERVNRLISARCAVLWIALDGHVRPMTGTEVVTITNPADAIDVIGKAATRAIRRTS